MTKQILQHFNPKAHYNKNLFDLSYSNKFTSHLGMLLPCYIRECIPGESVQIQPKAFARTLPLNSAAMVKINQNIDYFFVPMRLLWSQFPQFIAGTKFPTTSLLNRDAPITSVPSTVIPTVPLNQIVANAVTKSTKVTNIFGTLKRYDVVRMLDMLGYGDYHNMGTGPSGTINVSPFRMLAYQKIYADWYRQTEWENNDVNLWNADKKFGTLDNSTSNYTAWSDVFNILGLRFRNWKKDYFTNISPVFQGNDFMANTIGSDSKGIWSTVGDAVETSGQAYMQGTSDAGNTIGSTNTQDTTVSYLAAMNTSISNTTTHIGFTINQLRVAYALDKLYRVMSGARDGSYKSQMQARYGYEVYAPQYYSDRIGSITVPVVIDSLTTTADTLSADGTTGTAAGRIYGNGMAYGGNQTFKYDVKEHGIIMGISSFVPDVDYSSYGIHKDNLHLRASDFFNPEFQDLGNQPLQSCELVATTKIKIPLDSQGSITDSVFKNIVIGWQPRYSEYKLHYDEVHGELNGAMTNGSWQSGVPTLSQWTAPRLAAFDQDLITNLFASGSKGLGTNWFKINPKVMDTITINAYDGTQATDMFICEVNNNVKVYSPMSIYGQPQV